MVKKSYKLPQLEVEISKEADSDKLLLAVAGGRPPETVWLEELAKEYSSSLIYCADKGAEYCITNGLQPNVVLGDADSAGEGIFKQAKDLGAEVVVYPSEKDDTDLQLVLKSLPEGNLIITGVWGGRFDHLYSNIFSLAAFSYKTSQSVIMADDSEIMFLLKSDELIKVKIKEPESLQVVSVLPLTASTKVSLKGVHWPLNNAQLEMFHPYAISNVLEKANAIECNCLTGMLGLYCCFKCEP